MWSPDFVLLTPPSKYGTFRSTGANDPLPCGFGSYNDPTDVGYGSLSVSNTVYCFYTHRCKSSVAISSNMHKYTKHQLMTNGLHVHPRSPQLPLLDKLHNDFHLVACCYKISSTVSEVLPLLQCMRLPVP